MENKIVNSIRSRLDNDPKFADLWSADPENLLINEGITDELSRSNILKEVNKFFHDTYDKTPATQKLLRKHLETTLQVAEKFKEGLKSTIDQIDKGFRITQAMYIVTFYLGVVLILTSIVFAFTGGGSLIPIVFAGLGMVDFIFFFVKKPPQELQKSRADLAQLQAAYYNWFVDWYNWNSFLVKIEYIPDADQLFKHVKAVSDEVFEKTEKTLKFIRDYCEFIEGPSKDNN